MASIFKGIGKLFGFGSSPAPAPAPVVPPPPVIAPPPVMPVADDQAVADAKRRSLALQMARRGRASTILTDPVTGTAASGTDKLGG